MKLLIAVSVLRTSRPLNLLRRHCQVVEHGLSALATIVQIWEGCLQDIDLQEASDHFLSCASSSRIFSSLLQHAWLMQCELMEANTSSLLPASSCLDDLSRLLGFVMRSVRSVDAHDCRLA